MSAGKAYRLLLVNHCEKQLFIIVISSWDIFEFFQWFIEKKTLNQVWINKDWKNKLDKDVFLFRVGKNVASSIPKNHIFEHSGSKTNPRALNVSYKLTFISFHLVASSNFKIWADRELLIHFPLCSKTAHFNDLEHKSIFWIL